jgi:arsenate reductase (thioredoxin)
MSGTGVVLFLCPHNAAKSLLAAAYFDRLAQQRGLPYRADSAGTEPEAAPTPAVVDALRAEGVDVSGHRPRSVKEQDLARAHRVVSMGCDLTGVASANVRIERWDDVPPVSQNLDAAHSVIRGRVEELVSKLERETL